MSGQVYVHHPELGAYAWIPETALRQHGLQGWVVAEPPPPPKPEPAKSRTARGNDKKEND